MAPSPRESATSTFGTTWQETDVASLDPALLPISKRPRPWERRPQTVIRHDGKEKKVWRRYSARLAAANATANSLAQELAEEERDARARAVKRLQHVKPTEIEHILSMPHGRKRAFKGTRFDRRKSVLPRKKVSTRAPELEGEGHGFVSEHAAADTSEDACESYKSLQETDAPSQPEALNPNGESLTEDGRRQSILPSLEEPNNEDEEPSTEGRDTGAQSEERTRSNTGCDEDVTSQTTSPQNINPPQVHGSPEIAAERRVTRIVPLNSDLVVVAPEVGVEKGPEHDNVLSPTTDSSTSPFTFPIATEALESLANEEQFDNTRLPDSANEGSPSAPGLVRPTTEDTPDVQGSYEGTSTILQSPGNGDFEMSKSRVELAHASAVEESHNLDDATGDSTDEEFTEVSLQLEIARDIASSEARRSFDLGATTEQQEPGLDANIEACEGNDNNVSTVVAAREEIYASQYLQKHEELEEEPTTGAGQSNADLPLPARSHKLVVDITDGLTLTPSVSTPVQHEGHEEASQAQKPADSMPEEATITVSLDDDTALLKDFLNRAAASKANKVATIARRTSLQNRRDSDVVRQALASPRKILEDKDPNSPSKYDNDATLELSQTLTLNLDSQVPLPPTPAQAEAEADPDKAAEEKPAKSARRSTRTRKSRLPATASATVTPTGMPKNISVRRADGGEPIVLKKTEAQELNILTRANTRKNKQGAVSVALRLLKLNIESEDTTTTTTIGPVKSGKKNVQWDETLAYYQDDPTSVANALAEAESLATPDELSASISTPSTKKKKLSVDKKGESSSRIRRVRGLGAANGTPGKGLLAPASLLPEGLVSEKDAAPAEKQRLPKSNKIKRLVASSATGPSNIPSPQTTPAQASAQDTVQAVIEQGKEQSVTTKERKSRLATPRKVKLPLPVSTTAVDGKENQQQARSIAGATPKKGLKLPEVVVPPGVVDSALPRRRPGRKM